MSSFGLIEKNMELSHIYLTVPWLSKGKIVHYFSHMVLGGHGNLNISKLVIIAPLLRIP